jgi:hypothetical protein
MEEMFPPVQEKRFGTEWAVDLPLNTTTLHKITEPSEKRINHRGSIETANLFPDFLPGLCTIN